MDETVKLLKHTYENLNLGVSIEVEDDVLVVNGIPLDSTYALGYMNKMRMNSESRVKYLSGIVNSGVDIEGILSGFEDMKAERTKLFTEWYEKGRPNSYIQRG